MPLVSQAGRVQKAASRVPAGGWNSPTGVGSRWWDPLWCCSPWSCPLSSCFIAPMHQLGQREEKSDWLEKLHRRMAESSRRSKSWKHRLILRILEFLIVFCWFFFFSCFGGVKSFLNFTQHEWGGRAGTVGAGLAVLGKWFGHLVLCHLQLLGLHQGPNRSKHFAASWSSARKAWVSYNKVSTNQLENYGKYYWGWCRNEWNSLM